MIQQRFPIPSASGPDGVPISAIPYVNPGSARQYSPLRYPGGKTWLTPHIREWLGTQRARPERLLEPFAGGGTVSLAAVLEGLVESATLIEIDPDIAAFWRAVLFHHDDLVNRVLAFKPTPASIDRIASGESDDDLDRGFRALVLNRTRFGGILTAGAGMLRTGEGGRGIGSRWYPQTIAARIRAIAEHRDHLSFIEGDGLAALRDGVAPGTVLFVDPPYDLAGRRLYRAHDLDHDALFAVLDETPIDFLLTYERSQRMLDLARQHDFAVAAVSMSTTHHTRRWELLISREPYFTYAGA